MNREELDRLRNKCFKAMQDVDTFVEEHYEELCEEVRLQFDIPQDWELKIISNCGIVHASFRPTPTDYWHGVTYNNGKWFRTLHETT